MPQSLSQVIVHIVFSTKDRQKWLGAAISPRMHAYLATVCRDHDCEAYRVGGVVDHVHLAVRLGRTTTSNSMNVTCGIDQRVRSARMARGGGPMNRAVGARLCFFWHLFLGRCPRLV